VEAIAEEGSIPVGLNSAQLREKMEPMLQRALAERFKLVIRREPKETQVYELSVAATGARLTEAPISDAECRKSIDCRQFSGSRMQGLRGTAVTMADLAFALEGWTDRPVVDATGIVGLFSIEVRPFADMQPQLSDFIADLPPDRRPPPEPIKPSLPSILEKDLGLRLQTARAPIEMIRIESVDRPSVN
jgi:uncharacterized protein (TIGR03435 family)